MTVEDHAAMAAPSVAVVEVASMAGRGGASDALPDADWSGKRARNVPTYAALDLGTNNCRLLIARRVEQSFRVLDGFTRIVRLGEGMASTGELSDAAMSRTIEALRLCAAKLAAHAPARARLVATEACRSARNGAAFVARIKAELGMDLEIVDRETEARLAVIGCADLIEKDGDGALMFDIGGGSTELAWLDFRGGRPKRVGRMAGSIRSWQSLPVGVVSIAERFGGTEVTPESFEAMVAFVAELLQAFKGRRKLGEMIASHRMHLIGTSGTVTTLAGLHLGLDHYSRKMVDGLWMDREAIDPTLRALRAMPYERRAAHPCIGRDRADLVLPGCAIFEAIRREWPIERLRVADRGLREGIIMTLIDQDRARAGARIR